MISLSRVRPSQKNGGFIGIALQRSQHKNVAYWVSSHERNKKIEPFPKKMDLWPNSAFFYATPVKPHFFGSDRSNSIGS